MTEQLQLEGDERDAHVVEDICGYVTAAPPRSFFLFAGAGSGKTRTLAEVLRRITGVIEHEAGGRYATQLRSRGQSVRVITYTKNATNVVMGRLGDNDLTDVSTIHAFCWELIQGFDGDIRDARLAMKADELAQAQAKVEGRRNGATAADKRKFEEIAADVERISAVNKFRYSPDSNTYGEGALAHATVLSVTAWLLNNRPTLQRILAERHPLVLIDESQDTMRGILDALLRLEAARPGRFNLGLLGDHRQRIYQDGHQDLPAHVPKEWAFPALQMNHRSQKRVVDLINTIWAADVNGRTQPKTGVAQHARKAKSGGFVRLFIGDSKLKTPEKVEKERKCAARMADVTGSAAWVDASRTFKTLALEHLLAAKRGGFHEAYFAMNLLDEDAAAPKSNGEHTGPSMVRPLLGPVLDLAGCFNAAGDLDEFAAMNVLREAKALDGLPESTAERKAELTKLHDAIVAFGTKTGTPGITVRDALTPLLVAKVFDAHEKLIDAFADETPPPEAPEVASREAAVDRLRRGWSHLLGAPWEQVRRYRDYLAGDAELATHQVVKGSEFPHVMVVMDDEDANGFLFSYDKLFGAEPLSDTDNENIATGKETSVDRTLRLLYVTCSRAEESLALVLWARNRAAAAEAIKATGWFLPEEVELLD